VDTDSIGSEEYKFGMLVLRLLDACESGSSGGDACRQNTMLSAAVEDTLGMRGPRNRFAHLLGFTLGVVGHGLQTWILRGDRELGKHLFKLVGDAWKKVLEGMSDDMLLAVGITQKRREFAKSACTSLSEMFQQYNTPAWADAGAAVYQFKFAIKHRDKPARQPVDPAVVGASALLGKVVKRKAGLDTASAAPATSKKAKSQSSTADGVDTHDAGSGTVALAEWLAAMPCAADAGREAYQLRLTQSDGTEHHVVMSGATSFWKLAQFTATVCDFPGGPPEHHSQKGKLAPGVVFRVTRPGMCTDAIISGVRGAAKVGGKDAVFVDEKKTKVRCCCGRPTAPLPHRIAPHA
jgi:hypothetical protein